MIQRIRAIYRDGAFRPATPCALPENSEVELLIQQAVAREPSVVDPDDRRHVLRQVVERMQNNPLPPNTSRFSRDELHERD